MAILAILNRKMASLQGKNEKTRLPNWSFFWQPCHAVNDVEILFKPSRESTNHYPYPLKPKHSEQQKNQCDGSSSSFQNQEQKVLLNSQTQFFNGFPENLSEKRPASYRHQPSGRHVEKPAQNSFSCVRRSEPERVFTAPHYVSGVEGNHAKY